MSAIEAAIISGVGLGSAYALVGVAYNIVLASSGVFNLAQSSVITVAVVVAYVLAHSIGMPIWLIVPVVVALGGMAGVLSELIAVRRFVGRNVLHTGLVGLTEETVVTTLGLSLAMTALVQLTFGNDIHPVTSYVPLQPIVLVGILVQPIYIAITAVTALIAFAIEMVLLHTEIGLVMRAIIVDPEGASLLGTNVRRVVQVAFLIAGAMGGIVALLIAPITEASAFVGGSLTLYGFAALAIGGFGSFRGVIAGGVIVGLVSQLSQVFLATQWGGPAVLLLMLTVLLVRPAGLFGRAGLFGSQASREV
jgi:branched-chain amino acid transport system permease protein